MYYEINVAHEGRHFFATASRSITYKTELAKVLPVMLEKFPKSEGYEIRVSYNVKTGRDMSIEAALALANEK